MSRTCAGTSPVGGEGGGEAPGTSWRGIFPGRARSGRIGRRKLPRTESLVIRERKANKCMEAKFMGTWPCKTCQENTFENGARLGHSEREATT